MVEDQQLRAVALLPQQVCQHLPLHRCGHLCPPPVLSLISSCQMEKAFCWHDGSGGVVRLGALFRLKGFCFGPAAQVLSGEAPFEWLSMALEHLPGSQQTHVERTAQT